MQQYGCLILIEQTQVGEFTMLRNSYEKGKIINRFKVICQVWKIPQT